MVHKKSTYRLMYKNYGAEVRREVWQENNNLRLRRREQEMSHHSIEETESECECDTSDEEAEDEIRNRTVNSVAMKSILSKPSGRGSSESYAEAVPKADPPHIPRLQFSPEQSPRALQQHEASDEVSNTTAAAAPGIEQNHYTNREDSQDLNIQVPHPDVPQSRRNIQSAKDKLGVMRPGSREYDLLPVTREGLEVRPKSAPAAKGGICRSRKLPFTTQLSRTTRKNFIERNKTAFVPSGTGCSVRRIGDKTSYNIHLNKDQVQQTALLASGLRNKEIEHLLKKQQKMTLDDWREKNKVAEPVNHSSVFADGGVNIFKSKSRPRERLINVPTRVEVFSNYCKHCGGRK